MCAAVPLAKLARGVNSCVVHSRKTFNGAWWIPSLISLFIVNPSDRNSLWMTCCSVWEPHTVALLALRGIECPCLNR